MLEEFDNVIIGAGAGGLAMTLFLAKASRGKTLLIEKSPKVGGALGCFEKKGYRLDAGFHFAGGMQDGGIFDEILKMFGIRDRITPLFLNPDKANRFHFADKKQTVDFPYGLERLQTKLKDQFPSEHSAIEKYFKDITEIIGKTPTLSIETIHTPPPPIQEDSITFESYIKSITSNQVLRETLNALVMCHGSAPSEISLADNARLCYGFYESIATLEGGGSALVNAFLDEMKNYDIEIATSDEIATITDIKEKKARKLILKSGREISSDTVVFTIPPASLAAILPEKAFPPAFFKRIGDYEYTPGFFTLFAAIDEDVIPCNPDSITSLYPICDINSLSLPGWKGPGALAILHSKSGTTNILTAFEPLYWDTVSKWEDSSVGKRSEDYYRWKQEKTEEIIARITEHFPSYKNKLKVITASTPLTYRDYLHHYHGAAYGIKQKVGQFNLMGQLRIRNIYVAGQSAILPGVLGTIMASLLVAKNILGTEKFIKTLKQS